MECKQDPGIELSLVCRSLVSNPLILHYLFVCSALLYDIDKVSSQEALRAHARKPLHALVNIGMEPSSINELERLCRNPTQYDHIGVEGMLQVHDFVVPTVTMPDALDAWQQTRNRVDKAGFPDRPIAVIDFLNDRRQGYRCTLPFDLQIVQDAKYVEVFSSQPKDILNMPTRYDIAKCLK